METVPELAISSGFRNAMKKLARLEAAKMSSVHWIVASTGRITLFHWNLKELEDVMVVDEACHSVKPVLVSTMYLIWWLKIVESQRWKTAAVEQTIDLADEKRIVWDASPFGHRWRQVNLEMLEIEDAHEEDFIAICSDQVVSGHSLGANWWQERVIRHDVVELPLVQISSLSIFISMATISAWLLAETDHSSITNWHKRFKFTEAVENEDAREGCGSVGTLADSLEHPRGVLRLPECSTDPNDG